MRASGRMGPVRGVSVALIIVVSIVAPSRAGEPPQIRFVEEPGQVRILADDAPLATYVYADPQITRPYFAHVHAPGGTQVTRNHPPVEGQDRMDHPTFHPGIWMAFGDLSGNDYWRLKARVKHDAFLERPRGGPGSGSFVVRNRYLDQSDPSKVICEETCRFAITTLPAGYLLLWDSTFSSDREFYFGDQEEMGLGIRVATPLRVEVADPALPPPTGTMTDSEGRKNGAQIGGNTADWCDYSGTLDGQHVGMTVFCHPDNFRPSWFHARDYGFLAANPFGQAAFRKGPPSKVVVQPGELLRLRYGVLIHCGPEHASPDLATSYNEYVQIANKAE